MMGAAHTDYVGVFDPKRPPISDFTGLHDTDVYPNGTDIPDEFFRRSSPWRRFVEEWFLHGLPEGTRFEAKKGISKEDALMHVAHILSGHGSHHYKMAAAGYLLSEWFEDVYISGNSMRSEEAA
jgi:hypothetical protein